MLVKDSALVDTKAAFQEDMAMEDLLGTVEALVAVMVGRLADLTTGPDSDRAAIFSQYLARPRSIRFRNRYPWIILQLAMTKLKRFMDIKIKNQKITSL